VFSAVRFEKKIMTHKDYHFVKNCIKIAREIRKFRFGIQFLLTPSKTAKYWNFDSMLEIKYQNWISTDRTSTI
jgi:hypothetical protein